MNQKKIKDEFEQSRIKQVLKLKTKVVVNKVHDDLDKFLTNYPNKEIVAESLTERKKDQMKNFCIFQLIFKLEQSFKQVMK